MSNEQVEITGRLGQNKAQSHLVLATGTELLLLLCRRWFTRKPQVSRWSLVVMFWGITLILLSLALILFRD